MKFTLDAVPPFRLDLTAWTLRRDRRNEVDRWDGRYYRRAVTVGDEVFEVIASQRGSARRPQLLVEAPSVRASPRLKERVSQMLDKVLGLKLDMSDFYRFAARNRRLGVLAERFEGVKPPRFPSVWEAVVNAISCQQLSLTVGIILMNRLTARFGLRAASGLRAFPRPADVAPARAADLRAMGYNLRKAATIVDLARRIRDGRLDLERIAELDDEAAVERLRAIKGIGRWSAQYVLLRGLRRLNIFPADDVGFQNKLVKWLHLDRQLDYEGVQHVMRRWRAYGGMIYFFTLLGHLSEQGFVAAPRTRVPESPLK